MSLIIGTDKKGGLGVYDVDGRQLQYVGGGRFNNVDVRPDFPLAGGLVPLVASGEKKANQLVLFVIDPAERSLREIPDVRINTGVEPEGVALYRSATSGRCHVFVLGKDIATREGYWVEQWELLPEAGASGRFARRFLVGGQAEGLVADDRFGHLYVSEENQGIWRYNAEPDAGEERILVDRTGMDGQLRHDVEGLAIHDGPEGKRLLIASSQGSDDFVVYRLSGTEPPAYAGRFEIVADLGEDAVTHTDGIEVIAGSVGPRFPDGLFVCQDDKDDAGNQNFKLVSWGKIARKLGLE
ncbi:MAG: phytase [Planctomycetes bacterium]|nr:phytase [Planctomycetota bacterium]